MSYCITILTIYFLKEKSSKKPVSTTVKSVYTIIVSISLSVGIVAYSIHCLTSYLLKSIYKKTIIINQNKSNCTKTWFD